MSLVYTTHASPVGELLLVGEAHVGDAQVGEGAALVGLWLAGQRGEPVPSAAWRKNARAFVRARRQLDEYFAGRRRSFELALQPRGTDFQRAVWRELERIPFGATTSYGALARALGRPDAARAVGAANGKNPISIVVPCHRVIGKDGSLHGYAGGLPRKQWLLEHEGKGRIGVGTTAAAP